MPIDPILMQMLSNKEQLNSALAAEQAVLQDQLSPKTKDLSATFADVLAAAIPAALGQAFGADAGFVAGAAKGGASQLETKQKADVEAEALAKKLNAESVQSRIKRIQDQINQVDKTSMDLLIQPELARAKAEATFPYQAELKRLGKPNINIINPGETPPAASPLVVAAEGRVPEKEQIKNANEVASGITSFFSSTNRMKEILDKNPKAMTDVGGEDAREMGQLSSRLTLDIASIDKRGANLTGPEIKLIDGVKGFVAAGEGGVAPIVKSYVQVYGRDFNPRDAVAAFERIMQKSLEGRLVGNGFLLNFKDPTVNALLPQGSLLPGRARTDASIENRLGEIQRKKAELRKELGKE